MRTHALVESPAELVNVLEWAHHQGVLHDPEVVCTALAPQPDRSRRQLRATAALAREAGLAVRWHEPRSGGAATVRTVRSLTADLAGIQQLVVGNPFSGVVQVVVSIARSAEVVIVDDGTATVEFARRWRTGEPLSRGRPAAAPPEQRRQVAKFAREGLADSFRRRLDAETGGDLQIFTCLDVDLPRVPLTRNDFGWLRSRFPEPGVKPGADLVGAALAESGVLDAEAYVRVVAGLVAQYGVDRYLAQGEEDEAKLAAIAELGVAVLRPELPLEVALRAGPVGARIVTFPSTAVHTLPLVLAGVATELVVCDVGDHWYAPQAPVRSSTVLGGPAAAARTPRDRFGLALVLP